MFSDVESFALLFMANAIDQARAAEHAATVVEVLELDPRLADFIPLPPRKRKLRAQYERLLVVLQEVSAMPEPERSRTIDDVRIAAAAVGWRA